VSNSPNPTTPIFVLFCLRLVFCSQFTCSVSSWIKCFFFFFFFCLKFDIVLKIILLFFSIITWALLEYYHLFEWKVLIGCDGVNSVVSKWLGFKAPAFTGRAAIRGWVNFKSSHGFEPKFLQFFGKGFRSGFLPYDDNSVYWFFTSSQGEPQGPIQCLLDSFFSSIFNGICFWCKQPVFVFLFFLVHMHD
jgi:hypothetical protein